MNNNLEFENEDPSPDSIEDNHPRTNYGEGYGGKERMYSEEEVKDIIEQTIEKFYKHTYADKTKAEMKELWFEQFKKK
jgi:hypothetical protein